MFVYYYSTSELLLFSYFQLEWYQHRSFVFIKCSMFTPTCSSLLVIPTLSVTTDSLIEENEVMHFCFRFGVSAISVISSQHWVNSQVQWNSSEFV